MNDSIKKESTVPKLVLLDKIGASLQEIAADVVETENEPLVSRWFHSEKEVDVFYWLDSKNNVIKQQVNFCGHVVEWNILEGVKTGIKVEVEGDETASAEKEDFVYDQKPLDVAVGQVISLLEGAHRIKANERDALIENFRGNHTVNSMEVDEFYQKFGVDSKNNSETPFWEKFRKWFKA